MTAQTTPLTVTSHDLIPYDPLARKAVLTAELVESQAAIDAVVGKLWKLRERRGDLVMHAGLVVAKKTMGITLDADESELWEITTELSVLEQHRNAELAELAGL